MGAMTAAITAVSTVLGANGVSIIVEEFSNSTPPTAEHVVVTADASSLDRGDIDAFDGVITVTADWHKPGNAADGQAEFLAAMDAFDALVVALVAGLDRTCMSVDPSGNIEREEESSSLPHWYSGTIVCQFMRREPASS